MFVSQKIDWRFSGIAFADLPRFASKLKCSEELRRYIGDLNNVEELVDQSPLTGEAFANFLGLIDT